MLRLQTVILLATISTLAAAPASDDAQATISKYKNTNDGTGNYHFSFETSNGLMREETGELVHAGQPDEHISVYGVYSYIDPEGKVQTVRYTADEYGYVVIPPVDPDSTKRKFNPSLVATLLG